MTKSRLSEKGIMRLMALMLISGLILTGSGLYMLWFTRIMEQQGIRGSAFVALLIVFGLLLLIPAKVYIILRLTDKHKNKRGTNS